MCSCRDYQFQIYQKFLSNARSIGLSGIGSLQSPSITIGRAFFSGYLAFKQSTESFAKTLNLLFADELTSKRTIDIWGTPEPLEVSRDKRSLTASNPCLTYSFDEIKRPIKAEKFSFLDYLGKFRCQVLMPDMGLGCVL